MDSIWYFTEKARRLVMPGNVAEGPLPSKHVGDYGSMAFGQKLLPVYPSA